MKTLPLDKLLKNFKGKPILLNNIPSTLKDIYLHYLGSYSSGDGKSVISAYKLGIAISNCKDPKIELENADFLILKEATQTPQHGALVMGQLYEVLEEVEKEKEGKETK